MPGDFESEYHDEKATGFDTIDLAVATEAASGQMPSRPQGAVESSGEHQLARRGSASNKRVGSSRARSRRH